MAETSSSRPRARVRSATAGAQLGMLPPRVEVPQPRQEWLRRDRLLRQLDGVREIGIGLVVAGAGYGKTTLVASWIDRVRHVVDPVWLEVRAEHADPGVLAAHLGLALRPILPSTRGSLRSVLSSLAHAAIGRERPILLVLDDAHLLAGGVTSQALGPLLESRPAGLLLIVCGREEPPGPWPRLRGHRAIVELGPQDLAFDRFETRLLLDLLLSTRLPAASVDELHRSSEGWAAGLCLASYALSGGRDSSRSPTAIHTVRRYTRDYLESEVLADIDTEVLRFLEQASVPDVADPNLIELLTSRHDAAAILADLARRNRLVETLSDTPLSFRFHPVLREHLRERLRATDADAWRSLHALASRWYEDQGLVDMAVTMAVAGNDLDRAVELIRGACGPAIRDGYAATVVRWLDALPESMVLEDALLCLLRGRVRGMIGDVDGAKSGVEEARAAIDRMRAPSPGLGLALEHLEAGLDLWRGAIISARERMERIAGEYELTATDEAVRMLALDQEALDLNTATCLVLEGKTTATLDLAGRYAGLPINREPTRLRVLAYGLVALALALDGRDDEARRAIDRARRALRDFAAPASEPLALHIAAMWLADDPSAAASVQESVRIADRFGHPMLRALTDLASLRLALRDGYRPMAEAAADNARSSVAALPEPAYLADLLASLTSQLEALDDRGVDLRLSPAELSVLETIAGGATRAEAAEQLGLSINTVKTHLRSAYRKLGVERREEAVARATALGLLDAAVVVEAR